MLLTILLAAAAATHGTQPTRAEAWKAGRCLAANEGKSRAEASLACFRFGPSRPMEGLWIVDMDGSYFVDDRARGTGPLNLDLATPWLDLLPTATRASLPAYQGTMRAFRMAFVGRASLQPGLFGHYGMFARSIVVERLDRIAPVPLPEIAR